MPSSPSFDLSPKGVLNEDNNYVLQQESVYALLQYIWAGVLLPADTSAFQKRLDISSSTMKKLKDDLKGLLSRYAATLEHCEPIKDTILPHFLDMAERVRHYAKHAGGTAEDSFYASILQCIKLIPTAENKVELDSLKQTIKDLVDQSVKDIEEITGMAQELIKDLTEFQDQYIQDRAGLQSCHSAAAAALVTDAEDRAQLQRNLANDRALLKAGLATILHAKIVANTSLTFAWVPVVGIIADSIVPGIIGSTAQAIARTLNKVKKDITNNEGTITDETRLVADMTSIDADLDDLLTALHAASAALKGARDSWENISSELVKLQQLADKDIDKAVEAIANVDYDALVAKWNVVETNTEKFITAADVNTVGRKSLDDIIAQLHKQAESSDAN